ncbi:hypothetical protein BH11PSE10_BH11PSE10_03720 [soil metagenome]
MTANFDQACVELDKALFLRLANAAGVTITCLEGCLWITRDGSPADIQLPPGERYLVEDASRVIVAGFGPSLARVIQPAAEAQAQSQSRPRRLASVLPAWGSRFAPA